MAEEKKIPEVIIAGQEGPVEVRVEGQPEGFVDRRTESMAPTTTKEEDRIAFSERSLSPTTTKQQDITHAGQRTINLIWERTQSEIAKVVVYCGLGVNVCVIICLIILRRDITATMLTVIVSSLGAMNTVMGIIIGFYFSRTNHAAIGGIGVMPSKAPYEGR